MVNPVSSGVPAAPEGLLFPEPEHIAMTPNPALAVTAATETFNSNITTADQRQKFPDHELNPLEKALKLVNSSMDAWSTGMRFDIDPDTERVVVSIVDSATGTVLRTVPTEAVLRVAKMIIQLQGKSINTQA